MFLKKFFCFLKKYGVFMLVTVCLSSGICWGSDKYVAYLIENERKQQEKLAEERDYLQKEVASLEKSVQIAKEENLALEQNIEKVGRKLNEMKSYNQEVTGEDIGVLKERRQQALTDLQDWILYIFEEYYKIGVENHVYQEMVLEDMFTEDVISALSGGNGAAEVAITSLVDGISEGQSLEQIKDNALIKGSEWVTNEVTSYIGEKMLGSSLMSVMNTADKIFSDKPQLMYLINHLENTIQNNYFSCFYEVLALEEWNDDLYYECCRKAEGLQYLLEKIETYTGDETGDDIWRSFSYSVGVYGTEYHGTNALLEVYGEN